MSRSVKEHKPTVRAHEKVYPPQGSTQDLRVELALVLSDFRVLAQRNGKTRITETFHTAQMHTSIKTPE